MGAPKRIKDFTADATVSDTDRFPVDSAVDGTRAVPALDVRTYMQTGLSAGFVNPMTSVADIIVGGTAGAAQRLAKGTALQVPRMNAGATAIEWADPAGGAGNFKILALRDIKTDVTSGTATTTYLSYTVNRSPADWISLGIMYRAVMTGRCENNTGAQRTLDLALALAGQPPAIVIRLPIPVAISPQFIPWTTEFLISFVGDDLLWINATAYLGASFNNTTGLVDTGGAVYAGSKQSSSAVTLGVSSILFSLTYARDSGLSTYTTTFANAFIQQVQV